MPHVPLGKPLAGDASVASPFGYRIDPFLGRPALHSGVDLLQAYGRRSAPQAPAASSTPARWAVTG